MENCKEERALSYVCNLLGDMESQREWAVDKQSTGKRKHCVVLNTLHSSPRARRREGWKLQKMPAWSEQDWNLFFRKFLKFKHWTLQNNGGTIKRPLKERNNSKNFIHLIRKQKLMVWLVYPNLNSRSHCLNNNCGYSASIEIVLAKYFLHR